jgi:hypothetical protein
VLFFPDGELRQDALRAEDLRQYRTVILPDCAVLTLAQVELLRDALAAGMQLVVLGELGANLPPEEMRTILEHVGTRRAPVAPALNLAELVEEPQVRVTPGGDLMINVHRVADGAAVHLIRYDFDAELDRTPPLPELTIELRLPESFDSLSVHSPNGEMTGSLESDDHLHRIQLRDVPLFSVALLGID